MARNMYTIHSVTKVYYCYACVRVCVCVRTCMRVLGGEGSWVFAGTALIVVWMAMYLTCYSNYQNSAPFLPHYGGHTSLKNV